MSYEKSLDSLLSLAESKSTIVYPFTPNFISAFKAYTLGLSSEEYKRFKEFRSVGKWINSSDAFQKVTQISDSLLEVLSPQFKFPEFAQKNKSKSVEKSLIKKDIIQRMRSHFKSFLELAQNCQSVSQATELLL